MRNTSPVGWRVTRYDYINRQLYNGADGLGYLNANPPDLWLSADKGLAQVGARGLNGVDQKFGITNAWQFSTNSVTFEIFTYSVSTALQAIFGGGGYSTLINGMTIYRTNKAISIDIGSGSTIISAACTDLQPIINSWNHIVVAVDRTNHSVSMWLNSTKSTTIISSSNILGSCNPTGAFCRIGGAYGASTSYIFKGNLSRARIAIGYVYQTSDIEVTYNNGNGLLQAELPALLASKITHSYNLNEASGNAIDCVSSNHGAELGTSTTISSTDGPRESIVADNSGNDYHLSLQNYSASQKVMNWVTDQAGNEGLKFERASSHFCVSSTSHPFMGSTEGFKVGSIAVKFKYTGTTTYQYCGLFGIGTWLMSLVIQYGNRYKFYMGPSTLGPTNLTTYSSSNVLSTGWNYVGVSFDGVTPSTNMYAKIFVNGVEDSTVITAFTTGYNGQTMKGYNCLIGQGYGGSSNGFEGIIDYVKVFNVALSASDFVAMASGSTPATAPVMDYTFNDGPQESGVSNNDSIAGWKSREGKNYEFNQGTLANRPTWIANANHGQPGILFDGTNDFLQCNQKILSGTSGIIFAVVQLSSSAVSNVYSQASTLSSQRFTLNLSTNVQVSHRFNSTTIYGLGTRTLSTIFNLVVLKSEGSSYTNRINGKNDTPFSGNGYWMGSTFATSDLTNSAIGGWASTATFFPYNGRIAEIIAYDGTKTPSSGNILAIERYLLTKYGIST